MLMYLLFMDNIHGYKSLMKSAGIELLNYEL